MTVMWKIIHLDEVNSTNDYAKSIAEESPEGTVVIAKRQTAGKGRKGRSWASPQGGLWMSVILKPERTDPRLVFVGALAVVDTLADFGIRGWIKWPNDVWVEGKKIAGVLTEGKAEKFVVMGIGLNVNNEIPADLRETATSMRAILGKRLEFNEVTNRVLAHLGRWYKLFQEEPLNVIEAVKERTLLINREVTVIHSDGEISGTAVDILEDGSLLIDTGEVRVRVVYGDVSVRPGRYG
ncbi:biotin--[acetyl-CoA-carboxylase] ligase [Thermococcus waiotapuensis]|uniref:Biotin--[acetyl-CoA-carboxylase] ligase n=1 Tax=Thermococcus waiotapuensis TaxID=90909 RepID=A0AAE4NWS3_9EURY|nr:biotin--[acetyl-CoA-carboxylase] ligase [Thermococcus waiotapuensis]MDV3104756.1 biotin--[acetyl-CoA-carboxylase] ligase [Thermococcus waiotapuensis]